MYQIEVMPADRFNDNWFRIRCARNGKIIAHSEQYSTRSSMMRTVRNLVRRHAFGIYHACPKKVKK